MLSIVTSLKPTAVSSSHISLRASEVIKASGTTTLFTRAGPAHTKSVLSVLPDARYDEDARMLAWPPDPPAPRGGQVLVVAAGTADFGVAREVQLTAIYLGRAADLVTDVGIAGLHRILARLDQLRSARVIVVVAGMDGALPGCPKLYFGIVDVRDVADLHIRAMAAPEAAGHPSLEKNGVPFGVPARRGIARHGEIAIK